MSADYSLSPTSVRYYITTDVQPDAVSRVLELFSVRGVTPDLLKVNQYKHAPDVRQNLSFEIHVSGLAEKTYETILQKLLSQIGIQSARKENFFEINIHRNAS